MPGILLIALHRLAPYLTITNSYEENTSDYLFYTLGNNLPQVIQLVSGKTLV